MDVSSFQDPDTTPPSVAGLDLEAADEVDHVFEAPPGAVHTWHLNDECPLCAAKAVDRGDDAGAVHTVCADTESHHLDPGDREAARSAYRAGTAIWILIDSRSGLFRRTVAQSSIEGIMTSYPSRMRYDSSFQRVEDPATAHDVIGIGNAQRHLRACCSTTIRAPDQSTAVD